MKPLIIRTLMFAALALTVPIVHAQSTYTQRNVTEQFKKSATTTNATATVLDTIVVLEAEGGIIEVKGLAYLEDSASTYYATKRFRYGKKLGTLTVTIIDSAQNVTSDLSGAGIYVSASAGGNNLRITMVGKASTTLRWTVIPKQYFRRTD